MKRILELNKPYEQINADHFKTHDYLKILAIGGFEDGYLQPRGIMDLPKESSASNPDNTIHKYLEIDEDFKSKTSNDLPKEEQGETSQSRMQKMSSWPVQKYQEGVRAKERNHQNGFNAITAFEFQSIA
ncbi:unnamed protein product [Darwinula stevensoni]|uniref:Uncharacterized protein n=1 Tax=Darwinula stevensoni TaxID=69355 RepID=A0A7R9ACC1_9CRUS|nr:unnamed protein product [Darwinula stevensoni]CAG0899902.1 unnamed protein product [Darwinula stevensoni]